jgi:hypothetical protein
MHRLGIHIPLALIKFVDTMLKDGFLSSDVLLWDSPQFVASEMLLYHCINLHEITSKFDDSSRRSYAIIRMNWSRLSFCSFKTIFQSKKFSKRFTHISAWLRTYLSMKFGRQDPTFKKLSIRISVTTNTITVIIAKLRIELSTAIP